jgi:hypothetical protein
LNFGIAVSWRFPGGFAKLPRNGILARSVGLWELPNFASVGRGRRMSSSFRWARLPQRTKRISDHFPFDRFQFALPPDRNLIILSRKVGIGPVGARSFVKRESPP